MVNRPEQVGVVNVLVVVVVVNRLEQVVVVNRLEQVEVVNLQVVGVVNELE